MIRLSIERETRCFVYFVATTDDGERLAIPGVVCVRTASSLSHTSWNRGYLIIGGKCGSVKVAKRTFSKIVSAIMKNRRVPGYLWVDEGGYL